VKAGRESARVNRRGAVIAPHEIILCISLAVVSNALLAWLRFLKSHGCLSAGYAGAKGRGHAPRLRFTLRSGNKEIQMRHARIFFVIAVAAFVGFAANAHETVFSPNCQANPVA